MKKFLLAGIAFGALVLPAAAADMPIKAPAPVAVDIWTGGYVGANIGYGWGRDRIDSEGAAGTCSSLALGCIVGPNGYSALSAQAATFKTSVDRSGLIYGGQAGHNWLLHNMFWNWDGVLGVEVDYQGLSDRHTTSLTTTAPSAFFPAFPITQTATMSDRLNSFGTLRGRAGLLWGPSTLLYATAGVAFANARTNVAITQSIPPVPPTVAPYGFAAQSTQELFGPTIGVGAEWKWTANWSVKAEYLYADLYSMTLNGSLVSPFFGLGAGTFSSANVNYNTRYHENVARVGVNYRLP